MKSTIHSVDSQRKGHLLVEAALAAARLPNSGDLAAEPVGLANLQGSIDDSHDLSFRSRPYL